MTEITYELVEYDKNAGNSDTVKGRIIGRANSVNFKEVAAEWINQIFENIQTHVYRIVMIDDSMRQFFQVGEFKNIVAIQEDNKKAAELLTNLYDCLIKIDEFKGN